MTIQLAFAPVLEQTITNEITFKGKAGANPDASGKLRLFESAGVLRIPVITGRWKEEEIC